MYPTTRKPVYELDYPFSEPFHRLRERMNALFDGASTEAVWPLPVSIWREGERYCVEIEVPGLAEGDMDISVHDGQLVVAGERKPREDVTFVFNNRGFGKFRQAISMPNDVDGDSIEAELNDGVLRLTFNQKAEAKPRKIVPKMTNAGRKPTNGSQGGGE
jgi:HSP20 family protein